jgi:hypothetical protein
MPDPRIAPGRTLRHIPEDFERIAIPQALQFHHTRHVQHIDVAGVLSQSLPVQLFCPTERPPLVRRERLQAHRGGLRFSISAATVLVSLVAAAGAWIVASYNHGVYIRSAGHRILVARFDLLQIAPIDEWAHLSARRCLA